MRRTGSTAYYGRPLLPCNAENRQTAGMASFAWYCTGCAPKNAVCLTAAPLRQFGILEFLPDARVRPSDALYSEL